MFLPAIALVSCLVPEGAGQEGGGWTITNFSATTAAGQHFSGRRGVRCNVLGPGARCPSIGCRVRGWAARIQDYHDIFAWPYQTDVLFWGLGGLVTGFWSLKEARGSRSGGSGGQGFRTHLAGAICA